MPGSWTFDPLQITTIAVCAGAYARRARTLRARGRAVPRWRSLSFATGIAFLFAALVSPVHGLGKEVLCMHMLQHVLLGDLAPLFLLLGLDGALLRPLLAVPGVARLRALANPLVALPVWTLTLLVWHLPALYDAAVRHEVVHALEHMSFFAAGIALWLPVLETLPAPEWFGTGAKLGYVVGVRSVEMVLGNVLLWVAAAPLYGAYAGGHGSLSAATDQELAGAVMLVEGTLVTLTVLAVLFLRLQQEAEARQVLLERGVDPRQARRAVRHRRWTGLAEPS
jgi:putative membrane protein